MASKRQTIVSAPDLSQACRFLTTLAGPEPVTFQTFSDRDDLKAKRPNGTVYDPNARIGHGTLETEAEAAPFERLNAKGAGVYVMVNAGDGKGRTAKNVVRVRALFIDSDGAPYPGPLPLKPHLIVQSSPGKWHLYWLMDGLELADFATLQKVLAGYYGTDPSIHDLPRVMRIPGFYHRKGEPVMVQLLEAHDHPPYTPADTFTAWPFLGERLEEEKALEAEREQRRAELLKMAAEHRATPPADDDRSRRQALAILAAHHDRVANADNGARHEILKVSAYVLGGYVGGGYLEHEEVVDYLLEAAEACSLPNGEATNVIRWGLEKGAEKPLELTQNSPQMFGAKASFGATGCAPNLLRPSNDKTCLVQSGTCSKRSGAKPLLGGKPCL